MISHSRIAILLLLIGLLPAGRGHASVPAGLRVIETQYYRIHTDLDRALADELAQRLDAMYEEYERRLSDFRVPDRQIFEVYLFTRQADYMRLTNNRFPNTAGIYMSGRNLLAAFLENQGRDNLRRTLQHEAFHQFAHAAISPRLPIWLNEGIAQLFEEGIWTGDGFWLGQVPARRVRQLQADLEAGRLIPFRQFMALSHEQWSANLSRDAEAGGVQYNQAWAMVHFLVHAPGGGRVAYRQRLVNMLKLIHQGRDPDRAFREAFSDNIDGFEARFAEWVRNLTPTPEATLIEHQEVLADLLRHLSAQDRTFRDINEFRQAVTQHRFQIHYTRGEITWTSDPNPMVYFSELQGRQLNRRQLYFDPNPTAPLPDIVRIVDVRTQLRTRFYTGVGGEIEYEVLIEPAR